MNNLLEYYTMENCKKMFNAIEEPGWRIFKTIDEDGMVRQNKRQITTPLKLYKFIHQCRNPQKIYVSVSTFLSPNKNHGFFINQKVIIPKHYEKIKRGRMWIDSIEIPERYIYPRAGFLIADNIMLSTYFFIDIDSPDGDLNIAIDDGRKIIDHLKNNTKLKLHLIQHSGVKGIHLIYKLKHKAIKDPIERIRYYKKQKSILANDIFKLGLKTIDKIHVHIMENNFAVYSLTYSIKPNGNIVQPLDIDEFMNKDIYDILSIKPTRAGKQIARDGQPDDKKGSNAEDISLATDQYRGVERASISSPHTFFRYIDCLVSGLNNNYIIVIRKHKDRYNPHTLKKIQSIYNLSDFVVTQVGNYIYALNFKLVQLPRLLKILRKAKSENIGFITTRKHYPIQISNTYLQYNKNIDKFGKDILSKFKIIDFIESDKGINDVHSLMHTQLFNLKYNNLAGDINNVGVMHCRGDFNG